MDNRENVWKDADDFPDADVLRVATIAAREENNFLDQWLMEMTYYKNATAAIKDGRGEAIGCS